MKINLTSFTFFFTIILFSNKTFAQAAPGDQGGSSQVDAVVINSIVQPCPIYFKRNNGNGTAVCGGDAQVRVSFSNQPANAPVLVGILYHDVQIPGVMLPVEGDMSQFATKGYISYCLSGSNILPSDKLTLRFRYAGGQECWIVE